MADISLAKYDVCVNWIRQQRENGEDWDSICNGLESNDEMFGQFLNFQKRYNMWPQELTKEIWREIVKDVKKIEEGSASVNDQLALLIDSSQDSAVRVPIDPQSSWQLYKNYLLESGWQRKSVDQMEKSTLALLKRLSIDTTETTPVKGLVIGHVQSGKTANMAALMAMAADWGWNFFVVLSGTIENLRKQTQSRLYRDLNRPGNLNWIALEHLSKRSTIHQPQSLRLEDGSNMRYFTVCLKNKTRLRNLIEWMQYDANKHKQMKVIVIDDEADQASINTADIHQNERAQINNLIVNLVEGKKPNGEVCKSRVKAMNYISYTATPYANFLNESSPESLYPKNFISMLQPSNEYFGPREIFGIDGVENCDGMNIIRNIDSDDYNNLLEIHNGLTCQIPDSMQEAICWFLCAVASMRLWGYKKPISMLVHTSQKQDHHHQVSRAIEKWLKNTSESRIISMCEKIWSRERKELTKEAFRQSYPDYGRKDEEINDYPVFSEIKPFIRLLTENITNIPLGEDGELEYHSHIHLCIDNCANNGVNEDGMFVRLAYPDPEKEPYPSPAPAFIVVGGSTLSRGLTIEGLVSTYFLRSSCQADSLMQMGRWFGYRRGYELLPRIWMTKDTETKFKFLSLLEHELREDLKRFAYLGANPSEYGPRIKNTPNATWLRITGKRKMQSAVEIELDYRGISSQTIFFDNKKEILSNNIKITEEFIRSLGDGEISDRENALVWRNISYEVIFNRLLSKFIFNERTRLFNDIKGPFSQWVNQYTESGHIRNWNLIVAGSGKVLDPSIRNGWVLPGGSVGKVNRSRKQYEDPNLINIGALRAPNDLVADVPFAKIPPELRELMQRNKTLSTVQIESIRQAAGLGQTPQLIIYRVDKDSVANSAGRYDLNAVDDLIGMCITVPGIGTGAGALTIRIHPSHIKTEDNWGEDE